MSKISENNMLVRAITGTVYVLVIVLSIYFGGLILQGVMGMLTLFMLIEFYNMFKGTKIEPNIFLGPLFGLMLFTLGCYIVAQPSILSVGPYIMSLFVVFVAVFLIISIAELTRKSENPILNISVTIGGLAYIAVPMFILVLMDTVNNRDKLDNDLFPLLAIFIIIWCNDTFAYLVGRKFGKTKLIERISPKKTWEGFAGGVIFSIIAGIILAYFTDNQPYFAFVGFAIVVAITGTIGDLVESMFKRSLGLKDSGTILPGHGGLLDRLDSILFAAPFAFIYYISFLFD
ncbi:MAG: phosphatidate cytidylyltransferase [Crocinitomicaceae bacterium]|nr:phosphatidate cytidylyltransferase [Crocinitomicaceae bacterium]